MQHFLSLAAFLVGRLVICTEATIRNETLQGRGLDTPIVRIEYPDEYKGRGNQGIAAKEVLFKEDPTDVEEFNPTGDQLYPNNNYPRNNFPGDFDPLFPPGDINPAVGGALDAFTARKAVDVELLPGRKIKFLDTVTRLGIGWRPEQSEFVCNTPGIFFFTFSACGERFRHFRITLKHNEIGVVSAYGDLDGYQMATNSALLRLLPGDRVYLQLDEGGIYEVTTITGRAYNTFTGYRIL